MHYKGCYLDDTLYIPITRPGALLPEMGLHAADEVEAAKETEGVHPPDVGAKGSHGSACVSRDYESFCDEALRKNSKAYKTKRNIGGHGIPF